MAWVAVAIGGSALVGAAVSSSAAKKAGEVQDRATDAGISAQELAQQQFNDRVQPYSNIGLSAAPEISNLLGLRYDNPEIAVLQNQLADLDGRIAAGGQSSAQSPSGAGYKNVGGRNIASAGSQQPFDAAELASQREALQAQITGLQTADADSFAQLQANGPAGLDEINPLVSFLREQGFNDIQESAAARGRLGAGGTLKDLTRFNTDLASTVVPQLQQQRFNQLFNILGLGSNAATGQGTAALNTATNVGNLLGQQGTNQANTAIQQGQNTQNLLGNLAGTFGAFQGGAFNSQPPATQSVGGIQNPNQFAAYS